MATVAVYQQESRHEASAHLSANLVRTAVMAGGKAVLVDAGPAGHATRQVFQRPPATDAARRALLEGGALAEALVRMRIAVYASDTGYQIGEADLPVFPAATDLRGPSRSRAKAGLQGVLRAASEAFSLVVVDAPQLGDPLSEVALSSADRVLVSLLPAAHPDAEVRRTVDEMASIGVRPAKLLYVLLATEAQARFAEIARESLKDFFEEARAAKHQMGRLLECSVSHDLSLFASHGLEWETRGDWPTLLAALLREMSGPRRRSWLPWSRQ